MDNNFCELAILTNEKSKSHNCIILTLPKKDLIVKLNEENQYYYVFFKAIMMNMVCNQNATKTELIGTGILTTGEGCFVYNNNIQIAAQTIINIKSTNRYIVSNFTHFAEENFRKIQRYVINAEDLTILNKNFEDIKEKINEDKVLQEKVRQSKNKEKTTKFQIGILSAILICAAIFATIDCYMKFTRNRTQGTNVSLHHWNERN